MSDRMRKFRVYMHSVPSPAYAYYEGFVDVVADSIEDAEERAPAELKRTSFRDRNRDCWRITRVEALP